MIIIIFSLSALIAFNSAGLLRYGRDDKQEEHHQLEYGDRNLLWEIKERLVTRKRVGT